MKSLSFYAIILISIFSFSTSYAQTVKKETIKACCKASSDSTNNKMSCDMAESGYDIKSASCKGMADGKDKSCCKGMGADKKACDMSTCKKEGKMDACKGMTDDKKACDMSSCKKDGKMEACKGMAAGKKNCDMASCKKDGKMEACKGMSCCKEKSASN